MFFVEGVMFCDSQCDIKQQWQQLAMLTVAIV